MRPRRIAVMIGAIIVGVLVIAVAGVFVFTNTDWGRDRTRRVLVSVVAKAFHGRLHVGALGGNLLEGAILRDVSLTDSAGAPFFQAEEVRARYTILPFLHQRLYFDRVTVVHPRIVLDRPPHGMWNFDRIIPRDTTGGKKGPPGFGSWLRLTNVKLVGGYILSRSPWAPDSTLTRRQQDSVITYMMGAAGRQNIVRVPGGFQRIAKFQNVNGTLPLLQIADPETPTQTIDVASLQMVALPMRPPAVQVNDVRGRFLILHDSLYFHGMTVALAGSRLGGDGRYNINNDDLRLRLRANPVATNDLLWIDPDIPRDGTGALDLALDWIGRNSDYQATNASLRVAGATLSGALGVLVSGDTLVYHNTDMRLAHLDTRTIAQLFPTLRSPRQGFLTGRAVVAGSLSRLRVNGDLAFDDPQSGRSRIVAKGTLGTSKGVFTANNLHLSVLPFQVALARIADPTLPVGGIVTGNAVLNGSTAQHMMVRADVTHSDVTGRSHITGDVTYTPGKTPLVNADLQLLPLSLATVGQFAPAAGLHGEVAGPVRLTGPLDHLVLDATLTTPDGGSVTAQGSADLSKQDKSYDFAMATHLFDANSISTKAPRTQVTANASVHGHGVTPETIDAQVTANVQTSRYDSLTVDSAVIRATAANGVLHVDTLVLRIPHGLANVRGDFGLTNAHTGSMHYAVAIDSLGALSRFLPADTGIVAPRPGILAGRLARARADSSRIARATEVQRAITGQSVPAIPVDTPKTVQRSALLGALRADGVIQGNIHTFNVDGTARGTGLVVLGNTANVLNARYIWKNALSPQSYIGVGAYATGISAAGFAVDSMTARASYLQQRGIAALGVWQGTRTYDASADYILYRPQTEVQLNTLRLRFDSTVYALARPTSIRFGPSAVDIDSLDLRTPRAESRIFVDGHLPINGPANEAVNARFYVANFDVGNVAALLESDVPMRGLVSIDAAMGGTAANPTLRGAFGTTRVRYGGTAVPEVHGTVAYAGQVLRTNTTANLEGDAPFLRAAGTIPVNLAMTGTTGSRVPTDRPLNVQIDADSLPLDHLPQVSDALTNLRGFSTLHAHITGTIAHPTATGQLALQQAGMTVVPAGVTLTDANGIIRLAHDTVMIDSIVAHSGRGPIRLSGTIGITTLANPSFAITLAASNARVLGGEQGDLFADASLSLKGQLSASVAVGQIRLLRGIIQIPEPTDKQLLGSNDPTLYSVLDTSLMEHRDLFPTQSPLLKNLRANVAVAIDRDVFVRSMEANVEIYTEDPLQVTVNLRRQSFVVDGAALSDRGEYRYQGRRFIIRRGIVTFINTRQLDPTLQVTGEYTVQLPGREPIVIQIVISGTLGAPKIALTSNADPPISQTDLLSYLAFGQSSSSLLQAGGSGLTTGGSGSGNIVGRAAALAQQQIGSAALGALTDQVSGQAAHALGADVFDIMPADVSPDVGNFLRATQIEFGKYIQSRMYLGLQVRPDPASLQRPGFELQEILDPRRGYTLTASLSPRYLLQEPSLSTDLTPVTTSVFGLFLMREWRY